MKYYKEVSRIDFHEYRNNGKLLLFTDHEIKCLESFGDLNIEHNNNGGLYYPNVMCFTKIDRHRWPEKIHHIIYKLIDEWYCVNKVSSSAAGQINYETYYKCDQFEGLIKYLENV